MSPILIVIIVISTVVTVCVISIITYCEFTNRRSQRRVAFDFPESSFDVTLRVSVNDSQRPPPTYSTVMDNSITDALAFSITNAATSQLPIIVEPSSVDDNQSLEVLPSYEEATSHPNSRRNSFDIDVPSYEVATSQPNSRRSSFNLEVPSDSQPNSRKSSISIDILESF